MIGEYLGRAGFQVIHAENGTRGLALHGREAVNVVILDLMLPDGDGLDICRQIRDRSDSPILMLTARGDPMDRVVGLETGAEDICRNHSSRASFWRDCVRSCAAAGQGLNPTCCAMGGSRSTAAPMRCGLTARRVRSPAINSPCCWRSPSMRVASCRVTR